MTISVWLDERSDLGGARAQTIEADLAIVGGGIVGAAMAYFAYRRGIKNIVVLEAGQAAGGASGRNGGFILRGIHTYYDGCVKQYGREVAAFVYKFGESNQKLIRDFVRDENADIDYDPCGSYLLASSLEELDQLSRSAKLMAEDGFEVALLRDDPIDRGYYGALYNQDDFGINPVKLVRALLQRSKAQVLAEQPVRRLEVHSEGGIKITATDYVVMARQAILATNAYMPLLEPSFIDRITPCRGQMFATAPLKRRLLEKICYANYGWEYFRQLPDRRLVLGGCRQFFIEQEVGYGDLVTRNIQSELEHYMKDHFPELAGVHIDHRWSGVMAFTADGLPLVGELPHMPGVFFAVGCNGHGLGSGLGLGRLTVAYSQGDESLGVFDVRRKPFPSSAGATGKELAAHSSSVVTEGP
jgi:glycine/D-amino acid oxidase-like deaminating enzyme